MKTWCAECDSRRAYVAGRFAAYVGMARVPPEGYDDERVAKWQDGYDRQASRHAAVAAPDRKNT